MEQTEDGSINHKVVTTQLLVLISWFTSKESMLIVSAISTSPEYLDDDADEDDDIIDEGDAADIVDDAGLYVILDKLPSTRGFRLISFALVM